MSRPTERNLDVLPTLERREKQEADRHADWSRRSPTVENLHRPETVRTVKKRRGLLLLLPAAAVAGLGLYYSGMGKALLAMLPDYSGAVGRVGREAALPAAPGMRIEGRGTGGFTPPTDPPPPATQVLPPPMGGAGRRPL